MSNPTLDWAATSQPMPSLQQKKEKKKENRHNSVLLDTLPFLKIKNFIMKVKHLVKKNINLSYVFKNHFQKF